ncbi:MAG TPA: helix-turn-helix domain-containing protein, partial [Spirochaetia bacterium]|nr:helix-turn-helix domain-containing protein [Spirochaetia bacterium]
WPGNVRELRNVMERAVVLATGPCITTENFPVQMAGRPAGESSAAADGVLAERVSPCNKLEEMEKAMLLDVMRRNAGNVSSAARELGVSRDTLRYRIRKYDIAVG